MMSWLVFAIGLSVTAGAGIMLVKCAGDFVHCLKDHAYDWAISSALLVLVCMAIAFVGLKIMELR